MPRLSVICKRTQRVRSLCCNYRPQCNTPLFSTADGCVDDTPAVGRGAGSMEYGGGLLSVPSLDRVSLCAYRKHSIVRRLASISSCSHHSAVVSCLANRLPSRMGSADCIDTVVLGVTSIIRYGRSPILRCLNDESVVAKLVRANPSPDG
jgi:hypothetical protein